MLETSQQNQVPDNTSGQQEWPSHCRNERSDGKSLAHPRTPDPHGGSSESLGWFPQSRLLSATVSLRVIIPVHPDRCAIKSWQGCPIAMLAHRRSTNLIGTACEAYASAAEASNARRRKSFLCGTALIAVTLMTNYEEPHQCRGPWTAFTNQCCTAVGGKPLFCFPPLARLSAGPKAAPLHSLNQSSAGQLAPPFRPHRFLTFWA